MYLHIGNNKTIKKTNIIGIFDLDTTTMTDNDTRYFLARMQKNKKVEVAVEEIPKSFVLYGENKKDRKDCHIYMSQLSSTVLYGRMKNENIM